MEQSPYTPPLNQAPQTEQVSKSSAGPIVGAFIVIIILALGGLYFWGAQLNQEPEDTLPFIPGDDGMTGEETWLPSSSGSDDAAAIEAELEATNMNAFESEMNADLDATESSI